MRRTAKIRQAAALFIRGDNQTGRRITSLSELSRLTGCSSDYLRQVKTEDDWEEQALRFGEECRLVPSLEAGDLCEELAKDRVMLREKASKLREVVESLSVQDSSFESAFVLWERVDKSWRRAAGVEAMFDADRVRKIEAAKLHAKGAFQEEQLAKEEDNFDGFAVECPKVEQ